MSVSVQPIVVFCDGAAKGNPGPGGWGVVIATPDGRVIEKGGAAVHTTNNKMELTAAIQALTTISRIDGPVAMHTDSTYVIKGVREWIWAWRKRGWKTATGTDVMNRDLWQSLDALVSARGRDNVEWHYVRGHSGIPGNERVDAIADGLARGAAITLFDGPLADYAIPIFDLPDDTSVPARKNSSTSGRGSKGAYSYLSLVDGRAMRHATWAECERRVKGRSGARFKKAADAADESAILKSWSLTPDAL
jgi:ribonuclease HI